jgi:hypothetical protein
MDDESDYDRGYEDGCRAVAEAKEHGEAGTLIGELVGEALGALELFIDEQCAAFESDEYKEGFRQGVNDSL